MKEYTVEFRIHGRDLDPSQVTSLLGLEPSLVRLAGDPRSSNANWVDAMWSYNGFPESAGSVTWPSLEEGLNFVLEKLWPLKEAVQTYKTDCKPILWCGHFQSTVNESTNLSPDILNKLGDFGVELFIDSYCPEAIHSRPA
jgi:hypothetical protein